MLILPDYVEVIMLALIASFISNAIYSIFKKSPFINREELKEINELIREARDNGDTKRMNKLSEQYMLASRELFKVNIKPMIFSFITFIVAIIIIWTFFTGWFWLYFVFVIIFTYLLKKMF